MGITMKKSLLLGGGIVSLGAALVAAPAIAQDGTANGATAATDTATQGMIIVTARRRAESVQDVPIVIEALSADQIEQRGIATIEDVAKYTPGLVFDRGISLQDTRPVIRGLPATRGRPPVGVLLDNIDISTEALGNAGGGSLLNARLLDLERIEVVKGPQSALYGRAAFAGAVNYVTKRPGNDFGVDLKASYASFDTISGSAYIDAPLSDTTAIRLGISHAETAGDYDNPVTGGDLNSSQATGGSLGIEFDNDRGMNIYARASYTEYEASQSAIQAISGFTPGNVSRPDGTTPEGQALAAAIAGGAIPALGGFGTPTLTSNVPPRGDLTFTGVTGLSIDPRTGEDFAGSDGSTFVGTLNMTIDLGGVDLVYNGGYVKQNERLTYDGDFFGKPLATFFDGTAEPLNISDIVDFDNSTDIFTQEIRFQDFGGGPLRWAFGGLYWYSDTNQDSRSIRAISGFPLSGSPPIAGFSPTSIILGSTVNASPFSRTIESLSAYGLVEYDLTEGLTVSAEGRYIDESTDVTRSDFLQAAFASIPASFVNGFQTDSISDSAFVPRFAISYQASDDMLFYASAAKGFKPAGISELDFGSALTDSRFLAETVWNYEAGFKSSFADRQITLNAAVFFMDWTDKQVSQLIEDPAAPSGFRASVINAGAAEVLGLDASILLQPRFLPGLSLNVGYTYLDTEYTDFTVATTSAFTVTEGANCTIITLGTGTVCQVSYNGNRLERAPEHQIVGSLDYRGPITDGVDLIFGASAQYLGSRFLTESNRLTLPSYVNVDMQLGFDLGNYMVQGFVTNLTKNTDVRSAQNNFDLSTFGRSVNLYAPPRRVFGVRVSADF